MFALEPLPQIMLPPILFHAASAEMSSSFEEKLKDSLLDKLILDMVMAAISVSSSMHHCTAQKFKDYSLKDGILLYQGRVFVPDEPDLKQELLSHFHNSPAAGHQGRTCTLELIGRHYYWPAMKFQVNCYVDSCEICQRSKGHEKHYALHPLCVPSGPWDDVSYNFIVKFPKCKGYDSILVVVACFSKMMHLIPHKETATAEDFA